MGIPVMVSDVPEIDSPEFGVKAGAILALVHGLHEASLAVSPESVVPAQLELLADAARPPGPRPAEAGSLFPQLARQAGPLAETLSRMLGPGFDPRAAPPGRSVALAAVERALLRWMCDLLGLGHQAGGVLTGDASLAALGGMVAARARSGDTPARPTAYVGANARASVVRALKLAGIRSDDTRLAPTDPRSGMDLTAVAEMISADREAGLCPVIVVANAGAVPAAAVDRLRAVGRLARAEGLWFHADAGHSGAFRLTPRGRVALAGIELADSVTVDLHRTLMPGNDFPALLVRDGEVLTTVLGSLADPGRQSSAIGLWLALHLYGTEHFGRLLDRTLSVADYAHQRLSGIACLRIGPRPSLPSVMFRPASGSERIMRSLARVDHVFPVEGNGWLRLCLPDSRTTAEDVDVVVEHILRVTEK
jgi:aromatic-L-amino-acid decarboxylase